MTQSLFLRLTPALLCAVVVAGCDKAPQERSVDSDKSVTATTPPDLPSPPSVPSPKAETPRIASDEPPLVTAPATPDKTGFRSEYSQIPADGCKRISYTEEGASSVFQCAGYAGLPLFIKDGDGRTDLDAGVQSEFASRMEFNSPGATVEWRIAPDGKPFAIIYRLISDMNDRPRQTWLVAETVGTSRKPGCRIAEIAGSTPAANVTARVAADRFFAENSPCPKP